MEFICSTLLLILTIRFKTSPEVITIRTEVFKSPQKFSCHVLPLYFQFIFLSCLFPSILRGSLFLFPSLTTLQPLRPNSFLFPECVSDQICSCARSLHFASFWIEIRWLPPKLCSKRVLRPCLYSVRCQPQMK